MIEPDMELKGVAILGSTGSIGVQTLDVIERHFYSLKVVGLAAHSNAELLLRQAAAHGAKRVALFDLEAAAAAGVPGGMDAIVDIVTDPEVELVVVAVAGVIGLIPTIAAIRAYKTIALASKEVLVAAGEFVMPLAREHGVAILPIDSEHSAIFQCMHESRTPVASRLILTASGGPFRGWDMKELAEVTVEQALAHPTWRMGGKITIDSATLMNKGLETIEARWLFGVDLDQIDVVIHPQSIVHSFVEFIDGSVLAQLGWPDMRLPIQVALLWPLRWNSDVRPWSPLDTPNLTFEPVDTYTFRCLNLARDAAKVGGTMPCALNAANEEAANAFLRGEIGFLRIAQTVQDVMMKHVPTRCDLESVLEVDAWARETARQAMAVS